MNKLIKQCSNCYTWKSLGFFYSDRKNKDGVHGTCKICHNELIIKTRSRDPKKTAQDKRNWRLKNLDRVNRQQEQAHNRYSHYKSGAKRRGYCFEISLDQFKQLTSKKCHYCNNFSTGKDYCGIDRVDNSIGYTIDNIVPCCKTCNSMKRDMEAGLLAQQSAKIHWYSNRPRMTPEQRHFRPTLVARTITKL